MSQGDIFRFINNASEATVQNLIKRLEFRDQDPNFTRFRNDYLEKLDFAAATRVLDIGCGTGVVTRALARRDGFSGSIVGVDHSPALIAKAQALAAEAQLENRIEFRVGDIHALEFDDGSFDIVIAHTVLSHVTDPLAATGELARVAKPGGKVVIFDGDFASMTFAYPPDSAFAKTMEEALLKAVVNNPRVMRDLPFMFRKTNLRLIHSMSYVLTEVGSASYWASAFETFGPLVVQAGLLPEEQVNTWIAWQRKAAADGVFFASSNFYTYIAQRPEEL
jgi:ubiquinone/menaquinone biosynthesis C-methylase UbiE